MSKPNIAELAVAAWRLERWLENLNAERKLAAKKSLREIKGFLEASGIEVVDPLGWKFDEGLPLQIVNNEADDEDDVIIVQTTAPIVKENGAVIQAGKVILGKTVKEQKSNSEIKTDSQRSQTTVDHTQGATQYTGEAVLAQSQSQLLVERDSYWIRCFDLRGTKDGYQAAIEVAANFTARLCLMDEQVYYDYFNRGIDRTWFSHEAKEGISHVVPPYQDIWYVIAYPPRGQLCHDLSFNMNSIWVAKQVEESRASSFAHPSETAESIKQPILESNEASEDSENTAANEEGAPNDGAVTSTEDEKTKSQSTEVDADRRKKIKFFGKF